MTAPDEMQRMVSGWMGGWVNVCVRVCVCGGGGGAATFYKAN
jgi:hypothetical protein